VLRALADASAAEDELHTTRVSPRVYRAIRLPFSSNNVRIYAHDSKRQPQRLGSFGNFHFSHLRRGLDLVFLAPDAALALQLARSTIHCGLVELAAPAE
jgi:hypothetical protein